MLLQITCHVASPSTENQSRSSSPSTWIKERRSSVDKECKCLLRKPKNCFEIKYIRGKKIKTPQKVEIFDSLVLRNFTFRFRNATSSSANIFNPLAQMNVDVSKLKSRSADFPLWWEYIARRDVCSNSHGVLSLRGKSIPKDAVCTGDLKHIAEEEVKKTTTPTSIQLHFGLQATVRNESKSIEEPILRRMHNQDIETKTLVSKYCELRKIMPPNATQHASLIHLVATSQYLFAIDPVLAKQVQLERPRWEYDPMKNGFWKMIPRKKIDGKCIEESHKQLNTGATGKTEYQIAKEVRLLRQILPRNLQPTR